MARRLHDLDHSARWLIPSSAYIAAVQLAAFNWPINNTWLGFVLGLPVIAAVIWLIAAPGQPRENRFGPVPAA